MLRSTLIYTVIFLALLFVRIAVGEEHDRVEQCINFAENHPETYVLLVQLTEAQVIGNGLITEEGIHVKEATDIKIRVLTRAYLELRGHSAGIIKGSGAKALVTFDIEMAYLIATPGPVRRVIEPPASNIPDLVIGNTYLIMKPDEDSSILLFDCIFDIGSPAENLVRNRLASLPYHTPKLDGFVATWLNRWASELDKETASVAIPLRINSWMLQ